MRALVLILFAVNGCRTPRVDDRAAIPVPVAPRDATAADAAVPPPQRLNPSTDKTVTYPTRVCVEGNQLVFENDCGCNDALECTLTHSFNARLYFTLRTDPNAIRTCDDCFAMVPARCEFPALQDEPAGATWTVVINEQTAFAMPLDERGEPIDGSCWTQAP